MQIVLLCEPISMFRFVLKDSTFKIIGNSNVDHLRSIAKHINVIGFGHAGKTGSRPIPYKKFQLHLRSFDVVHSKTIGLICTAQDDSRIFVNEESNAKPTN